MTPERKQIINGREIREYYWAGKMVVYFDNRAYEGTYEQAIQEAEEQADG